MPRREACRRRASDISTAVTPAASTRLASGPARLPPGSARSAPAGAPRPGAGVATPQAISTPRDGAAHTGCVWCRPGRGSAAWRRVHSMAAYPGYLRQPERRPVPAPRGRACGAPPNKSGAATIPPLWRHAGWQRSGRHVTSAEDCCTPHDPCPLPPVRLSPSSPPSRCVPPAICLATCGGAVARIVRNAATAMLSCCSLVWPRTGCRCGRCAATWPGWAITRSIGGRVSTPALGARWTAGLRRSLIRCSPKRRRSRRMLARSA